MHRRGRSLASLSSGLVSLSLLASLSALTGCGGDEFSDEAYGAIDLAPYFFDGSSAANPTAGLPREIAGKRGWVGINGGKRAEFYDFGLVNFTRKRSAVGATLAEPDTAKANPIYFFYDGNGNPMFSRPVFDKRTGTFNIRGGINVLNPNPRTPPPGSAEEGRAYNLPYSARARNTIDDPNRHSDDYQRPIIDKLQNDAAYAGVWEIIAVTVKDSGYVPDTIKSAKTLLAARDAGKVSFTSTGKVINCPVLDDRTFVTPSSMAFMMNPQPFMNVQPRIEVWFRTKLGSCFLANGWETIGRTLDDGNGNLQDPRELDENNLPMNVELRKADDLSNGLDTFDVIRYAVGNGRNVVNTVVVPIGKHYIPKVTVATLAAGGATSDVRYAGEDMEPVAPRHFDGDPPGYSPLVWLQDVTVPQDPPFQGGTFKSLDAIDPTKIAPRTGVFVKNFPLVGIASECRADGDADCAKGGGHDAPGSFKLTCNRWPDIDLATTAPPTGKTLADIMIDREGGPRCDVPKASFGEYCAPGVARCENLIPNPTAAEMAQADTISPDKKLLTADKPKFAAAGPEFKMPAVPAAMAPAMGSTVPANQPAIDAANAKIAYYKSWGYYRDYLPRGYACHPSNGGYCYVRCDGSASAGAQKDVGYKKDDGTDFGTSMDDTKALAEKFKRDIQTGNVTMRWAFPYDARCGGTAMLGYQCSSTRANAQRVCLRTCATANTDLQNKQICDWPFNDDLSSPAGDGKFQGQFKLGSNSGTATDGIPGQSCNNLQGATACTWNPDFEPRGPDYTWPQ
jgi:hypothetical protein